MFQNEILNLISSDDLVDPTREKRQHLLLEAVGYASAARLIVDRFHDPWYRDLM